MCGRAVRIHEDATWGMVLDGPILWFAAGQHLLGGDGPSRHEGHKEDRESKLPTEIGHGSTPSEFGCPALCDSRELMRGAVPCQTRSLPTITGSCGLPGLGVLHATRRNGHTRYSDSSYQAIAPVSSATLILGLLQGCPSYGHVKSAMRPIAHLK